MVAAVTCSGEATVKLAVGAQIVTEGLAVPGVHPVEDSATPVPLSAIVCGDEGSESLMLIIAVRTPEAVGEKITLIVQLPPAARLATQLSVSLKSPVVVSEATVVGFTEVKVTACGVLAEPRLMLPNCRVLGVIDTLGVVVATFI